MLNSTYRTAQGLFFSHNPWIRRTSLAILLAVAGAILIALFIGIVGSIAGAGCGCGRGGHGAHPGRHPLGLRGAGRRDLCAALCQPALQHRLQADLPGHGVGRALLRLGLQAGDGPGKGVHRLSARVCWSGLFMLMMLFSFANGLTHSAANSFFIRRFMELLLGISLFFVAINTVRSQR